MEAQVAEILTKFSKLKEAKLPKCKSDGLQIDDCRQSLVRDMSQHTRRQLRCLETNNKAILVWSWNLTDCMLQRGQEAQNMIRQ